MSESDRNRGRKCVKVPPVPLDRHYQLTCTRPAEHPILFYLVGLSLVVVFKVIPDTVMWVAILVGHWWLARGVVPILWLQQQNGLFHLVVYSRSGGVRQQQHYQRIKRDRWKLPHLRLRRDGQGRVAVPSFPAIEKVCYYSS